MDQQVTYRIGRGVPASSPAPRGRLLDWALDTLPKVILPALLVVAIFFTSVEVAWYR